jgi:hypothetical protein
MRIVSYDTAHSWIWDSASLLVTSDKVIEYNKSYSVSEKCYELSSDLKTANKFEDGPMGNCEYSGNCLP